MNLLQRNLRANISETVLVLVINEQGEKEKSKRWTGILLVLFFLLGVWLARNEAKASIASRSEVERQPERGPCGAGLAAGSEVVAKAQRRSYPAE